MAVAVIEVGVEVEVHANNAQPATECELALIAKTMGATLGDIMVAYCEITQFDSATCQCQFQANIDH